MKILRFLMHCQRCCWKNRENIFLWINDLSGSKQATFWTRGKVANAQTATFRWLPFVACYVGIRVRLGTPQLSIREALVSCLESETEVLFVFSGFPRFRKEDAVILFLVRL